MNINLANIDFAPGQGGGGEAVIRTLNVTANGTYRAPSGVDGYSPVNVNVSGGGSVTPEEQAALDTLVNSSEGALYTEAFERYNQKLIYWNDLLASAMKAVFWDDLYIINNYGLYKLNRESYHFDKINDFSIWTGPSFFGDKSGRLYWNGYELDLENGTVGQVQINVPEYYGWESLSNVFYGEYGVWILGGNAYKFNESSQVFEQMPLNSTFQYGGQNVYVGMFRYDGHILGVEGGLTFEVTEYEDHIDVADVTDVYFNMPSFGTSSYGFKSTKDGDLYYINGYNIYIYDKSLGDWVTVPATMRNPNIGYAALVSDNVLFGLYVSSQLTYMNLGSEFNNTSWTDISNIAVDLKSNQVIEGQKTFNGNVIIDNINVRGQIYSDRNVEIYGVGTVVNRGSKIIFKNGSYNETIVKNGTKQIATVDQTFINNTFMPYGTDGDNIGYVNGTSDLEYNFNTYTYRMFKRNGDDWYEFDGTNTLIPVSFGIDFNGSTVVYNSPNATIMVCWDETNMIFNTYMWNDANTRWDLICSSNDVGGDVWFDGDDFRCRNEWKLVETGGVWSWVSDPLVNNIWDNQYSFGYKNGEVYAYNGNDWHMYKYDKVNCTLDKIGFVNAGRFYSYFNEMFIKLNSSETYIIDLSKVDPQNPDENLLGKMLFNGSYPYHYMGALDRLWYYDNSGNMCSSYENIYETPEVPASNGTYVLKATRVGDQITYEWIPDNI